MRQILASPLKRTVATFFGELLVAGLWAKIDPQFVADNATAFILLGAVGIIAMWFLDQISEFLAWKRSKGQHTASAPASLTSPPLPPPKKPPESSERLHERIRQLEAEKARGAFQEVLDHLQAQKLPMPEPNSNWNADNWPRGLPTETTVLPDWIERQGVRLPYGKIKKAAYAKIEEDAGNWKIRENEVGLWKDPLAKKRWNRHNAVIKGLIQDIITRGVPFN